MSRVWRQTISDDLDQVVEETRARLHLSIQEMTVIALALFCEQHQPQQVQPPAQLPTPAVEMLSFN